MTHLANRNDMTERQRRIFDFIDSNRAGVLASVDSEDMPHATVIYHVINETDFSISFLTKKETRKYSNLIHNKHVMLVIFDATSQTVVQVVGQAHEITDSDTINAIAAAVCDASLQDSPNGIIPIAKLKAGELMAFRIKPEQIRLACYAQPGSGDYDHVFESIESFELELPR